MELCLRMNGIAMEEETPLTTTLRRSKRMFTLISLITIWFATISFSKVGGRRHPELTPSSHGAIKEADSTLKQNRSTSSFAAKTSVTLLDALPVKQEIAAAARSLPIELEPASDSWRLTSTTATATKSGEKSLDRIAPHAVVATGDGTVRTRNGFLEGTRKGIRSEKKAVKPRVISLVVPLWKAKADLGEQLSYLAHAVSRKLSIEQELVDIKIQLVADSTRAATQDLHALFPGVVQSFTWLEDVDEEEYLAAVALQEAWLKQRYPSDVDASTETTLNVDLHWKETAFHLQTLLQHQGHRSFQESPHGKISLPFLVSSEKSDMGDLLLLQDDSFRDLFQVDETACGAGSHPEADETVIRLRDVELSGSMLFQQAASNKKMVIVTEAESDAEFLESCTELMHARGLSVRVHQVSSQAQAFCYVHRGKGSSRGGPMAEWTRLTPAAEPRRKLLLRQSS